MTLKELEKKILDSDWVLKQYQEFKKNPFINRIKFLTFIEWLQAKYVK